MAKEIVEWRGCKDLVAAELLTDTNEGLTYGEVFDIAGLAELTRATENSSETHYYDDQPAIVINSTGADTVTVNVSAIPMDVLAKITGQTYDSAKGVFIEDSNRESKYFALGYKTAKTNGDEVYVWRLKGSFSIPDSQHTTKANDATANGQSITYTGIATTYRFTTTSKSAKAINVDVAAGLTDVSDFFDEVQTPDTLTAAGVAKPTAYPPAGAFTSGNTVYLACSTDGATIRYTTDGSTPTTESSVYSDGITLTATTTIKAIAIKNSVSSEVASFTYTVS